MTKQEVLDLLIERANAYDKIGASEDTKEARQYEFAGACIRSILNTVASAEHEDYREAKGKND